VAEKVDVGLSVVGWGLRLWRPGVQAGHEAEEKQFRVFPANPDLHPACTEVGS